MKKPKIEPKNPPIAPETVFLGLKSSHNFLPPIALPIKNAALSLHEAPINGSHIYKWPSGSKFLKYIACDNENGIKRSKKISMAISEKLTFLLKNTIIKQHVKRNINAPI